MTATKKQWKVIGKYVRWVANEMELRDWTFTISRELPSNPEHQASICCTYGRKYATLYLSENFWASSLESQRSCIAHELIHCHLSGLEWQFNNLGDQVAAPIFNVLWGGLKDQIEFATDAMADAIAKHLPVPKQAKEKKAA